MGRAEGEVVEERGLLCSPGLSVGLARPPRSTSLSSSAREDVGVTGVLGQRDVIQGAKIRGEGLWQGSEGNAQRMV